MNSLYFNGQRIIGCGDSTTDISQITGLQAALDNKQNVLTFDSVPTQSSKNPVMSDGIYSELQKKPNRNLLGNWYFIGGGSQQGGGQFPINQRGEAEWTGSAGYKFDRWKGGQTISVGAIKLTESGLYLAHHADDGGVLQIAQSIESIPKGETVTLSVLTSDNRLGVRTGIIGNIYGGNIPENYSFENIVLYSDNAATFGIHVFNNTSITIVAAKLELGPIQTLAHKEGDTWVLNEIPNYAEQYAICKQYSPTTGEFVGSQHSNPNLLDNWYFSDPINQRGEKSYSVNGYTIDRWRTNLASAKVTIVDGKYTTISSDGITMFYQRIEGYKYFQGKTVTCSALTAENELASLTFTCPLTGDVNSPSAHFNGVDGAYLSVAGTEASDSIVVRIVNDNSAVNAVAAKLELGPIQTLAHKEGDTWVLNDPPPDKALELAKCQRYYLEPNSWIGFTSNELGVENTRVFKNIRFPVKMRAVPTITVKSLNGTSDHPSNWGTDFSDNATVITVPPSNVVSENGITAFTISNFTDNYYHAFVFKIIANAEL